MSEKTHTFNNFTKSCDFLVILKHQKPKSHQNETFTLKGQTTGTERGFILNEQNK